jgi:hypothetical protein
MSYELILEKRPTYLHAKVVGDLTPANALRFLEEAYAACVQSGYSALLLEMLLSGPSLNTTAILDVISQRAPDGSKLRRIAYVHPIADDPAMPHFAELAARNRGVNVRLFLTAEAAALWLSGANRPSSL